MLIQYIGYIKVTVGTSGPGYHSKCQLKWSSNVALEAHGELHGNLRGTGPRPIASSTAIWSPSSRPGWAGTGQKVS